MDEKCLICQEIHDPETYVFLGELMDKFQNLMEGSEFDLNSVKNALICKNCENKIDTFFDFKSSFMEKEDELLNYVDEEHTVDLCAMLIIKGALEKRDYHGTLKVCRICFETTEESNFKEIKTYESDLTKLTTCYPDFDIFLTGTTYICPKCERRVLKFYDFYSSCFEAIKNVTILEDPLSLDVRSLIRERILKAEAQNRKKSCPPEPVKRKRGRPRKVKTNNTSENKYFSKEEIERKLQKANGKKCHFSFECQVCPGIFDSLESLLMHMEFHETQKKIVCWKCGVLFSNLRMLRTHFYNHGIDIYKIVVQEGGESDDEKSSHKISTEGNSLLSVDNPSIHKVNDTIQRIECQLCLQKFRNYRSFQKHMEDHEKVKDFHCLKCIYSSQAITDIQRHLATSHKIPNLYKVIHFNRKGHLDVEEMHVDTTKKNLLPITNSSNYCCGHCSEIFFDLNELDDHTCIPQATGTTIKIPFKNKPNDNSSGKILVTIFDTNQSVEEDYECDFCSSSFKTLKALDNHECPDDEDSSSHNFETHDRNLKCSTCTLEFESSAALGSHRCSKFSPTVNSNCSIDSIEDINEKRNKIIPVSESYVDLLMQSCDKSISTSETSKFLVKIEKQHNSYSASFPSKSEAFPKDPDYGDAKNNFGTEIDKPSDVVKSPNVQENGDIHSVRIGSSDMHCKYGSTEMANDSHISKDETVKPSVKENPNRKEVINRIANMLGVQIVEGANRDRQNMAKEFDCVGCNFKAPKKKDLLIHTNYCEKVKKCSYCPYVTNVSDKLELHSYVAHDVIVYACSNCRFVTSMEENFKSHISIHSGIVENDEFLEEGSNKDDFGKKCVEVEDKINVKDENVNKSVHVEQKWNDEIDDTSESDIEYIGEFFLSNNDQDLGNSYEVVDPIRLDNENTCNTSSLNGETLLSRRPQNRDSSTRIITEKVSGSTDVIDINSDSDNEFIESSEDRATIVGEIRTVDHDEASQLIMQGIPVVNNSDLRRVHIETSEVKSDSEATESASEIGSNDDWADFSLSSNHTLVKILNEAVKKHEDINKETNGQQPTVSQQLCFPESDNIEQNSSVVANSDGESQTNQESDDDCIIVPNEANERPAKRISKISKNPPGHSSGSSIIKRPPNAYHLFSERLKKAMEKRLPSMKGTERRSIIVNIWKNMSHQEKWLYLEEARLQRLLFKREHPELCQPIPRKRKKLYLSETIKPVEERSNLNEEIILD